MSAAAQYTEVAVTLPVPGRYHYRVPAHLASRARVGARVLVRFGPRKVTGVVVREGAVPPEGVEPVDLTEVLDEEPALSRELVELCLWVAEYYEAPPGEVMRAALPAGSGVVARGVIAMTEAGRAAYEGQGGALPPKQRALLAKLAAEDLPAGGLRPAERAAVDALVTQGLVERREQRGKARARLARERVARLAVDAGAARDQVARAPKRWAVVELLAAGGWLPVAALEQKVPGAKAALRELAKVGLVELEERELPLGAASSTTDMSASRPPVLTAEQATAVAAIVGALGGAPGGAPVAALGGAPGDAPGQAETGAARPSFTPFLLHGVTGSGKTEVYLQVIAEALARGKTALVLVPEISLTPQLAARFRARFGDLVAILHSGLTEQARLGEWSRLRRGDAKIAVGARSAVFAPLTELGVIVVDEEHDGSFKQDEGVRYHARDVALVRAQRAGAVCVLGSATPSLETAAHAEPEAAAGTGVDAEPEAAAAVAAAGLDAQAAALAAEVGVLGALGALTRGGAGAGAAEAGAGAGTGAESAALSGRARRTYRKLVLTQRPTARPMPAVDIVDLRKYVPDGDAMLSAPLRVAIGETLGTGDQTILFLNRRGFATFVLCKACGHAFRCPHCSVSLTYHRHSDRLSCHYCGFQQRVPEKCPMCATTGSIERKGLGTEKVAEAVATEFPMARVARLDRDVASGAKIEAVLARVARREIDILVGTQMVTKGHDFPGVTLVGVLCADTGLNLPDFRASERTFQLLAQVAGRAGRGDRPGRVLIQTYRPAAPAVVAAAAHDYEQFFRAELAARADLGYPPHGRLIAVRIDGPDPHEVAGTAQRLAQLAEVIARRPDVGGPVDIRGPVAAPLERLRGRTRWQVWLRSADRHALRRVARGVLTAEVASSVRVGLDVDPMSAL